MDEEKRELAQEAASADEEKAEKPDAEAAAEPAGEPGSEKTAEKVEEIIEGMTVNVDDTEPCVRKFSAVIPKDTINREIEKKMRDVLRNVQIKGFRKGRVPRRLVEKRYGKEIIEELKSETVAAALEKIIEDHELKERSLGDPKFDPGLEEVEFEKDKDLTFSVEFEIKPEFELPEYRGIEIPKIDAAVTDEDIEKEVHQFKIEHGTVGPAEGRELRADDFAGVNVAVVAGDKEVSSHKGLFVPPGQDGILGMVVENLHESLEGLNIGEDVAVSVTFPEEPEDILEIPESERGQQGVLRLELVEIKEVKPAEITPELLKKFDLDDEDELRSEIRKQLGEKKKYEADEQTNENIIKKLLVTTEIDVPQALAKKLAANVTMRQAYYRKMMGEDEEKIRADLDGMMKEAEEPAADTIKRRFLLEAIADKERIFALDEEVYARISMIAAQRKLPADEVEADIRKRNEMDNLRTTIREEKLFEFLRKKAKYIDVPAEPGKEDEEKDEV
ncbi:MAG: trigger factor [Planctomycetota bacterium]|nr:MAG: trigger factor [Planctomycetota bacterium]